MGKASWTGKIMDHLSLLVGFITGAATMTLIHVLLIWRAMKR